MAPARYHLLVVDDEPYIGRIVRMQFERGPFQVTAVGDGTAALRELEGTTFHCVLLDINLPDMNGLDILERMRQVPGTSQTPVVVLTAAGESVHVERARSLRASAFMTKPFSSKKLYRKVAELVGADTEAIEAAEDD